MSLIISSARVTSDNVPYSSVPRVLAVDAVKAVHAYAETAPGLPVRRIEHAIGGALIVIIGTKGGHLPPLLAVSDTDE